MSLIWINGHLIDKAEARVSPFDHGFLYGDGVWEPLRVFDGRLHLLRDHLDSLARSADRQAIPLPLPRAELAAAIESTVRANGRTNGYVRVIVTRGPGTLGPDPRKIDPQVIIIAEEYRPFPSELADHGLHAVTFPAQPAGARLLGRPDVALAKRHAIESGCLEAILRSATGELLGATEGMVLLVSPGGIVVARADPIEVTGAAIAGMARDAGIPVVERAVQAEELLTATEVLVCGTACGVFGIVRIDGRDVGDGVEGPVTRQLRTQYRAGTDGIR